MFDIGFMELMLIAIVALLVVGPEKLPGAIRTGALWAGRAKRSFNQVKADIEREINADEIRRQLHNESILADIEKAKKGADKLIADTKKNVDSVNADVNSTLAKEKKALDEVLQEQKKEAQKPPEAKETPNAKTASAEPDQTPAESAASLNQAVAPESAPEPTAVAPQPEAPKLVEDFYNNPPAGIIRLQGGVFQQVDPDEEESDQEPQRKS